VYSHRSPYLFTSTEIHSPTQRPIFTDEANGDFTLASGSPGKNAGHDGASIGISWNNDLTREKFRQVFSLPTQVKTTGGATSIVLSGLSAQNEYQVFVYPPSNHYVGTETFLVNGQSLARPYDNIFLEKWPEWHSNAGAFRYITLGNHLPVNGELRISWQHANGAEKFLIRKLPTVEEAYGWITEPSSSSISAPLNLSVK
jgi:hypothetical protein